MKKIIAVSMCMVFGLLAMAFKDNGNVTGKEIIEQDRGAQIKQVMCLGVKGYTLTIAVEFDKPAKGVGADCFSAFDQVYTVDNGVKAVQLDNMGYVHAVTIDLTIANDINRIVIGSRVNGNGAAIIFPYSLKEKEGKWTIQKWESGKKFWLYHYLPISRKPVIVLVALVGFLFL